MKILSNIQSLFEKFEIGPATTEPNDNTIAQYPYQYTWPQKDASLGDFSALISEINSSTKGDGNRLRVDIGKFNQRYNSTNGTTPPVQVQVGISKDDKPQQNINRLIGKDLSAWEGYIYIFKPGVFDENQIPKSKKFTELGKTLNINGSALTFKVDADYSKKWLKTATDGTAKVTGEGNKKIHTVASLVNDGPINAWYTQELSTLINQTATIIEKFSTPFEVELSPTDQGGNPTKNKEIQTPGKLIPGKATVPSKAVPIFLEFISHLPNNLKTSSGSFDQFKHTEELQAAIDKLINEAKKIDTVFSIVKSTHLNNHLYTYMAYAILLIGLNSGDIDIKLSLEDAARSGKVQQYYRPIQKAKEKAMAVLKNNAAEEDAKTFDGTAITNETELAKVISGLFVINYAKKVSNIKNDIDSVDKVKAFWNKTAKKSKLTTADDDWTSMVNTLPWKKKETKKNANTWFNTIQQFAISGGIQAGVSLGPYGEDTTAKFLTAFKASAF